MVDRKAVLNVHLNAFEGHPGNHRAAFQLFKDKITSNKLIESSFAFIHPQEIMQMKFMNLPLHSVATRELRRHAGPNFPCVTDHS